MMYTCPMHPEVKQDKPGMCPECGMALVETKEEAAHHGHHADHSKTDHSGHDKHKGHSTNIFAKKFWVSLVLTIPIVLQSFLFARHSKPLSRPKPM